MEDSSPLLLIYLNFKGMAHVTRHLLCFLGVPFIDVLLDRLEEQRKTLPACVFDTLKGLKIDKTLLPVVVHEGIVVEELFPIMCYLCRRFDREDLLGKDFCQKVRLGYPGAGAGTHGDLQQFAASYAKHPLRTCRHCRSP
jgi:hypothetical protein